MQQKKHINVFNEKEYINICNNFKIEPSIKKIDLKYTDKDFFTRMENLTSFDRRGEVVFCVIRPNGKIITTRCQGYPNDIYRIPTGGLGYEEQIIEAVFREVKEELGLFVGIVKFGGVLEINFIYEESSFVFYSYLFILKELSGRLLVDALDDEISEIKEVDLEELKVDIEKLNSIRGKWQDWGKFRYITTKAVSELI